MAFEYTPYRNPYIGTIADLMARGEDAKAKALIDVASAQARAAEAKGQIYGNAISSIGQSASKALSDYTLEKQNAPIRAAEAAHRAALSDQDIFAAGQRKRQLTGQDREDTARDLYSSAMQAPSPYQVKQNGAWVYDIEAYKTAAAQAGVVVESDPFVQEMVNTNEFRLDTQNKAGVRAQQQAGLLLGMPDEQLMLHAPAAVAGLKGLYNDDVLNSFMEMHASGDVKQVRSALGQLAGANYNKPQVPGQVNASQFGDTRVTPGTPAVKMEGNPVSMMEDGQPVSVIKATTPDGGSRWMHLDNTPVTGRLTGAPGAQEWVIRNGALTPIPQGTRQMGDKQAPAPRTPSTPGSIGAAIDQGSVGEDALKGLPVTTQALVKKIANYEVPISTVSMRGGERERMAALASLYDPTFDVTQYGARNSLRRDFTSGKGATNIRSINTAVGHLADLKKSAQALDNTSFPSYNNLGNWLATETGSAKVTKFNAAVTAVSGELSALFKGTGSATDQEIKEWRENINSSQSNEQLMGFVDTAVSLMRSRLRALSDQWENGMGKPRDFQILSSHSKETLRSMGLEPSAFDDVQETTVAMTSKDGKLNFNIPANEVAQALKDGLVRK
jgi:hypothetical protein